MATKSVAMNGAAARTNTINREVKATVQSVNLTNQTLSVTSDLKAESKLDVGTTRKTSLSADQALELMAELKLKTREVTAQNAELVEIPLSLQVQGTVTHNITGLAEVLEKTALQGDAGTTPTTPSQPEGINETSATGATAA